MKIEPAQAVVLFHAGRARDHRRTLCVSRLICQMRNGFAFWAASSNYHWRAWRSHVEPREPRSTGFSNDEIGRYKSAVLDLRLPK